MKQKKPLNPDFPVHDYRPALQCAVSWLGDRYLLAAPVQRVHDRQPFYVEARRWLPTTRH